MRILVNIPNTKPADTDYPNGNVRNKDLTTNPVTVGTSITEEVFGDIIQFFLKLCRDAGVTANDLADNTTNGYQLITALRNYIGINWFNDLSSTVSDMEFVVDQLVIDVAALEAKFNDSEIGVISHSGTDALYTVNCLTTTKLVNVDIANSGDTSVLTVNLPVHYSNKTINILAYCHGYNGGSVIIKDSVGTTIYTLTNTGMAHTVTARLILKSLGNVWYIISKEEIETP
jgi:hypothetical protein